MTVNSCHMTGMYPGGILDGVWFNFGSEVRYIFF